MYVTSSDTLYVMKNNVILYITYQKSRCMDFDRRQLVILL